MKRKRMIARRGVTVFPDSGRPPVERNSVDFPIHSTSLTTCYKPATGVGSYTAGILRFGRKGSPRISNQPSEVFRCQTVGALASRTAKVPYSRHPGDGHEKTQRPMQNIPTASRSSFPGEILKSGLFPHYSQTAVSADGSNTLFPRLISTLGSMIIIARVYGNQ